MKSLLIPMSYTPDSEACARKAAELSGSDMTVLSYGDVTASFVSDKLPIFTCKDKEQLLDTLSKAEKIILVSPDFQTLYKLASGECTDDLSECVLRALLWGVEINVLVDFELPKHERDNFFGKLNNAFSVLRTMGIGVESFTGKNQHEKALSLVTESDVIAAKKSGFEYIVCTKEAIVTQLAEDALKDMNMQIVRNTEC